MNRPITIIDEILQDRQGRSFSVWVVIHRDRVISVEFSRDNSMVTDRVEMAA